MRLIVQVQLNQEALLRPYVIASLGEGYQLVHVPEEKIEWLKKQINLIEPDYKLKPGKEQLGDIGPLIKENILLVTFGNRQISTEVDVFYHLSQGIWENGMSTKSKPCIWISIYDEGLTHVSSLIKGMEIVLEAAKHLNKKLVIYWDVEPIEPYFKYRSLSQRIINELLIKSDAYLLQRASKEDIFLYKEPGKGKFEPYENRCEYHVESHVSLVDSILKRLNHPIKEDKDNSAIRKITPALYNDLFYRLIPDQEKIYVPINLLQYGGRVDFNKLDLNIDEISNNYSIIHDTKARIDAVANEIRTSVMPNFTLPIVVPATFQQVNLLQDHFEQNTEETTYTGKGVYIGIIGTQSIDYTQSMLRTTEGKTRIACIWEQQDGSNGNYYTRNQINEALASETPEDIIHYDEASDLETIPLILAGGKGSTRRGIAIESEFLIAKIKSATPILQDLYGGKANPLAALYPDVLIGIGKLLEVAQMNQKPLVLYMPYLTNIGPHDDSNIYNTILRLFAKQPGCTIIIPSGEEANKNHHIALINENQIRKDAYLQATRSGQNLIGVIYARNLSDFTMSLDYQGKEVEQVFLEKQGIYKLGEATIYSNGLEYNFDDGNWQLLFRISNMMSGAWHMTFTNKMTVHALCDMWISQQLLNPYVILNPADTFITLSSIAATLGTVTVGNFNEEALVVSGSSGRGFARNGAVKPDVVTNGYVRTKLDQWKTEEMIEGTAMAASLITGVVALFYEKWVAEKGMPYANSLVMLTKLLGIAYQFEAQTYPNQSQGYGVINLYQIPRFLKIPFE